MNIFTTFAPKDFEKKTLFIFYLFSDASFNARGMEHVYFLANTFLDLIQRDNVLPPSK